MACQGTARRGEVWNWPPVGAFFPHGPHEMARSPIGPKRLMQFVEALFGPGRSSASNIALRRVADRLGWPITDVLEAARLLQMYVDAEAIEMILQTSPPPEWEP